MSQAEITMMFADAPKMIKKKQTTKSFQSDEELKAWMADFM